MSVIDRIKASVAEAMMIRNGWAKDDNSIEWDLEREDSQYSLISEDVDFIVERTFEHITNLSDEEDYEEEEQEQETTVTTSAALFVFMDAGVGNPSYVSDVREWLRQVDRAGISDDTEVEGTLHLSVDIRGPIIEKIECGGCGEKDTLLTSHQCEETPKR